jgi:hypothetical protein
VKKYSNVVADSIVGSVAIASLLSIGGLDMPFPKLVGNEPIAITLCIVYFVRSEDKFEKAEIRRQMEAGRAEDKAERQEIIRQMEARRAEDKAERAADRERDKAEKAAAQKEMRVTAFVNFLVAISAALSSIAYTVFEISK